MSSPWLKFYPSDWRADPALRMCSIAARGLWMEMLCVMHEADPYGSLRVNGNTVSERQMASLAGIAVDEASELIAELEQAGVLSRDGAGVIISRRMQRDKAKAEADRENGKRGGNPGLREGVNPPVKGEDKAQIPEARSQSSLRSEDARNRASFAEFWSTYPNKTGKPVAEKAYLKAIRSTPHEAIMAGLAQYVSSKPADRPWLNPSTFLNQERWNDQPANVTPTARGSPAKPRGVGGVFSDLVEHLENGPGNEDRDRQAHGPAVLSLPYRRTG